MLWSKPLASGQRFQLVSTPRVYLHHESQPGEFFMASDSVIPTYSRWLIAKPLIEQFAPEEHEAFVALAYTIGGCLIWPGNLVGGKQTINGARGFNRRIADRLDLTLECVRRHYSGEQSPLSEVLARYSDFFALFEQLRRVHRVLPAPRPRHGGPHRSAVPPAIFELRGRRRAA